MTVVNLPGSDKILAAFKLKRIDGFSWSSPTAETAVADADGFLLFDGNRGQFEKLRGYPYISVNSSARVIGGQARSRCRHFCAAIAKARRPSCMTSRTARATRCSRCSRRSSRTCIGRLGRRCCRPTRARPRSLRAQAQRIADLMRETGQVTADIPLERWASFDLMP